LKICPQCKQNKPLELFNRHKGTKDGRYSWCKQCSKLDKLKAHAENPLKRKERQLKKNYGITMEDFNRMHSEQAGLCAVCHKPETSTRDGKVMQLSVDHDHTTKAVRALLCSGCNTSLGLLNEDETLILNLANYIKSHRKGNT
jgi:hypothetical protein